MLNSRMSSNVSTFMFVPRANTKGLSATGPARRPGSASDSESRLNLKAFQWLAKDSLAVTKPIRPKRARYNNSTAWQRHRKEPTALLPLAPAWVQLSRLESPTHTWPVHATQTSLSSALRAKRLSSAIMKLSKNSSRASTRAQSPAVLLELRTNSPAALPLESSAEEVSGWGELLLQGDTVTVANRPRHRWIQRYTHAPRKKGTTLSTRLDPHDMSNSRAVREYTEPEGDVRRLRPTPVLNLSALKSESEIMAERAASRIDQEARNIALVRKDDVQPWLGPQLKKNLARQGMAKQKLSLEPDEWDDDAVRFMLGAHYKSEEEERKARHLAWYEKNMGKAYLSKLTGGHGSFVVGGDTIEKMSKSSAHVSVVEMTPNRNQRNMQESMNTSFTSMSMSNLSSPKSDEDDDISNLSLASILTTKLDSSALAPIPLLNTKRPDRLRQRTRFFTVQGAAGTRFKGRNYLQPMTATGRSSSQQGARVGSPSSVPSLDQSILPFSPFAGSFRPEDSYTSTFDPPHRAASGSSAPESSAAAVLRRRRLGSIGSGGDPPASSF